MNAKTHLSPEEIFASGLTKTEVGTSQARPAIQWNPPTPRSGLLGVWDRFVGPGATRAEIWLQVAIPLIAGLLAAMWPRWTGLGWPAWQWVVAGLLAVDTVGGVITNSTNTAKRWYHRAGQTSREHLGFVAVHLLQLMVVGWIFRSQDWVFVFGLYAFLMVGATWIVSSPKYLQRPVASTLYLVTLVGMLNPALHTPGLEWFVPIFFLKLFVSHLPMEAPLASEAQEVNP